MEEKEFLLYIHLSVCAFYLLSKVTRLALQESLKITVKYISSFYIWLQCSRVSFTCFIDLTCPVNTVCCLLVQSCTSIYGNYCIFFLKPGGGTQWLYHSGRRNEEPSSICFVFFFILLKQMKGKRDQKRFSYTFFEKQKTLSNKINGKPYIYCLCCPYLKWKNIKWVEMLPVATDFCNVLLEMKWFL